MTPTVHSSHSAQSPATPPFSSGNRSQELVEPMSCFQLLSPFSWTQATPPAEIKLLLCCFDWRSRYSSEITKRLAKQICLCRGPGRLKVVWRWLGNSKQVRSQIQIKKLRGTGLSAFPTVQISICVDLVCPVGSLRHMHCSIRDLESASLT